MDFRFTEEHVALRSEVREFLRTHVPADWVPVHVGSQQNWEAQLSFVRSLAPRRWIAPAWPEAFGGLNWSHTKQMVFNEEFAYAGAPEGARVFNVGMIGPTLIVHGTDEQKAEHLPRITSGDVVWCQGYSEPEAGSDLANLQTKAVKDGDDYVINGQKIWTTGAHHADWCFLLARTDPEAPKHRGISFLLVDMASPGISVEPLVNLAGHHEFNQIFLENVRVPVRNRVGEENNGWYVAMTLLDFERSSVASVASNQRTLENIADHLRLGSQDRGAAVGNRLADLWIANETGRLLAYQVAWLQEKEQVPNYEASVIKILATELAQQISNFGVNVLGLSGALMAGSKHALHNGRIAAEHLNNVSPTIYSGANEIQRNIVATRGLGLPRD